jgi:squalene-hopene/tetraprenyl-beta-curcumene cyclase
VDAKRALENLLVIGQTSAYCQPCVPPVWDTALASLSLFEASNGKATEQVLRALDWLRDRQLLDLHGDWRRDRPHLKGGGWPFQFSNPHYPDLDDTAVVAWAMYRIDRERYREAIHNSVDWICGMQSRNGGFASFDVDNTHYYLNEIPFADHGALLDPPTSDVSARCATLLAFDNHREENSTLETCLKYLYEEQEPDGSWFGRWGTNYIYGTWSVLVALAEADNRPDNLHVRRAAAWLKQIQRPDGGWGEDCRSYSNPELSGLGCESTSFQTAWAMLGLMAAGEAGSPEVRRGAEYLIRTQRPDGLWKDEAYTAPGFPRVFYLRYHGYDKYFPLWALARYRNMRRGSV